MSGHLGRWLRKQPQTEENRSMDALSLLIADHNRVRGLFARFQAAEEDKDAATMM